MKIIPVVTVVDRHLTAWPYAGFYHCALFCEEKMETNVQGGANILYAQTLRAVDENWI